MIEWKAVSFRWRDGKEFPTGFSAQVGSFFIRIDETEGYTPRRWRVSGSLSLEDAIADDPEDAKLVVLELFAGHCRAAARLAMRWRPADEIEAEAAMDALRKA